MFDILGEGTLVKMSQTRRGGALYPQPWWTLRALSPRTNLTLSTTPYPSGRGFSLLRALTHAMKFATIASGRWT